MKNLRIKTSFIGTMIVVTMLLSSTQSVFAQAIDPAVAAQAEAIAAAQAQAAAIAAVQAQQAAAAQTQAIAAAQAQAEAIAAAQAQAAAIAAAQAQAAAQAAAQAQAAAAAQAASVGAQAQTPSAASMLPSQIIADQQTMSWFMDAGFVGNSVSVGFASYAKKQYANYFGYSPMMAKESYSFANDSKGNAKYRVSFGGYNGQAKDVIAKAGVKKVFINMGTNDLWAGADNAYNSYVNYIQGIKAANPGILIFIEATTPVMTGNEKGGLTNKNVDALNAKMKSYCATSPDLFFVDINTPMKDSTGGLNPAYCSDKFVHINGAGYKVWCNTVIQYVKSVNGFY